MYITNDAKICNLLELAECYNLKYELLSTEWENNHACGEDVYGILVYGVNELPDEIFDLFYTEGKVQKLISDYFEEDSWLFYDPEYETDYGAWLVAYNRFAASAQAAK